MQCWDSYFLNVTCYILLATELFSYSYILSIIYNKVTIHIILLCVHSLKLSRVKLNLSRDMIALLDNVQILAINKKLVNKLHSVGFVTL